MRVVAGALAVLVSAAAPSGAVWTTRTTSAPRTVTTGALVATAAPKVTTQCFVGGTLSTTITWTTVDGQVTGYEVYRLRDGTLTKIADVPSSTTSATDGGSVLVTSLKYYVVGKRGNWRATSPQTTATVAC